MTLVDGFDPSDVRVGIVGLGGIGHHHAEQLEALGADLVGGMDVDADARARFYERFDTHTRSRTPTSCSTSSTPC